MARSSSRRGAADPIRTRFRLLELGLLLPIIVTGVLGAAYFKALGARQRAVEAAGRQIARRFADRAEVEASRIGDRAAWSILRPVHQARPGTAERMIAVMQQATDSLRRCKCGPLKEGAYFFVWVPATGEFTLSSPAPIGADPQSRLPVSVAPGDPDRPNIWPLGGIDSAGPWLIHYTKRQLENGEWAVIGFDISMTSWWNGTFTPAIRTAAQQFFPMIADPDTAFSAALLIRETEVSHTTESYRGPSADMPIFGDGSSTLNVALDPMALPVFALRIALNPSILPVSISAAAPPSYTVFLGALGASVLLSVLALLLLRQLRRTLTRREAFVASISHELRTPLTEVLLHAETLALDRQTPNAKARAATAIVRETRRLIGLVENALTIAGAGRVETSPAPLPAVALAPLVRSSLDALASAADQRQARLVADLDEGAASVIDPVSVDRIVTNLVDNALRYGPVGQTIRVCLARDADLVRLTVEDGGTGVEPRDRARIWVPFERGAAAQSSVATGVGLGLAIVKHLSEVAGGAAVVGSAPDGGGRFTVTLPFAPAPPPV